MPHQDASFHDTVDTLYRSHHAWLFALLRRKLGDREYAAELAQDTFERVWKAGATPALDAPRAYLTTVAGRLAINHFRRQALERAYHDTLAHAPEAYSPSPETRLIVIDTLTELWRLVDGMPARMRRIFLMAHLDGQPYAEIAAQLGVSLNIVQKDAIAGLQHCYRAIYDTPG